ncbi:unnamed protein product [Owenia fusiformis]|uniref:Uncharacterized protein n=1 Tax=Owenia fusiformis TaxID=6347 RepID=A0A8J1XZM7_OWEFU|nr:unnamed protein product [Owenia fusiformis]
MRGPKKQRIIRLTIVSIILTFLGGSYQIVKQDFREEVDVKEAYDVKKEVGVEERLNFNEFDVKKESNVKTVPQRKVPEVKENPSVGTFKNDFREEVDTKKAYDKKEVQVEEMLNSNKEPNVKRESDAGTQIKVAEVKEKPSVDTIKNTDKWIIVTSIASPTEDIKSLATLSEWQLLVVADTKTPKDWHLNGVIFLSIAVQQSLGYKVLEHIPYSNYARKTIGHLYAIQHGAKVIYETDDDNHPTDGLRGFITTSKMYGVVPSTNTTVLNAYAYYGQPTTWPRGYPLDKIGDSISSEYNAVNWNTPLIQQGAVNGDPDVDAIYRLTRKSNSKLLNLTYDGFMPPLFYPKGTFVPFNSQNTLWHYDAFWGLMLPMTLTLRVTDIWRSYFTQTLLWLIDGHLSYMPPNCYQFRNYHSYILDAQDEGKLYNQASELITFLSTWKCKSNSLSMCMQILADAMAHKGFWETADVKQVGAWLQDLVTIGYKFPAITTEQYDEPVDFPITLQSDNRFPVSVPSDSKLLYIGAKKSKIKNLHYNTCNSYRYESPKSSQSDKHQLTQPIPILLLVIFNTPHYESIPYLEELYDGHFAKTLYCGPEMPHKAILHEWEINFVTFKQAGELPGSYNYECLLKVLKLGLRVKGILTIADDAIMKVKAITKLPLDEVWFNPINFYSEREFSKIAEDTSKIDLKEPFILKNNKDKIASVEHGKISLCNISNLQGKCEITNRNTRLMKYEMNIKHAFDELYQLQNSSKVIQSFLVGLSKHLFGKKRIIWQPSDVFYIPQKHFEMAVPIVDVFYRHEVFLEYAVPTILHSLGVKYSNMAMAAYNWNYGGIRDKPWIVFSSFLNSSLTFLHPVKLSGIVKNNSDITKIFCDAMNSKHFVHPFGNESSS